jgi:hypothetical protein
VSGLTFGSRPQCGGAQQPTCFLAYGLLGLILLACANHQSGPAGLHLSGLRPTAPGEQALPRVARRSGAVPVGNPVAEVKKVGWGKHRC